MKHAAREFQRSARTTLADVAGLRFARSREPGVPSRAWNAALCVPLVRCIRDVEVAVGANMQSQVAEQYPASEEVTALRPISHAPYVVLAIGGDGRELAVVSRAHEKKRQWGRREAQEVARRINRPQDARRMGITEGAPTGEGVTRHRLTDQAVYLVTESTDRVQLLLEPGAECVLVWLSVARPEERPDDDAHMPLRDGRWVHEKITTAPTPRPRRAAQAAPQRIALSDAALAEVRKEGQVWFARHAVSEAAVRCRSGRGEPELAPVQRYIDDMPVGTLLDLLAPLFTVMRETGFAYVALFAEVAKRVVGDGCSGNRVAVSQQRAAAWPMALRKCVANAVLDRLRTGAMSGGDALGLCSDVCVLVGQEWRAAAAALPLSRKDLTAVAVVHLVQAAHRGGAPADVRSRLVDAAAAQDGYTQELWDVSHLAAVPGAHPLHRAVLGDNGDGLRVMLERDAPSATGMAAYLSTLRPHDRRVALPAAQPHILAALTTERPLPVDAAAALCTMYHTCHPYPEPLTKQLVDAVAGTVPWPPGLAAAVAASHA
eukprot:TRINITY_DN27653_c0_g1_i1.p1 TRINITY_DN27653_c0_g1~~TRINITY_DN27653_c0_g1_i1.p1  ORF type:complete len:545 (+),score=70.93 TRINITY_DN27653_c0_g1_i1:59-1693(+)